MERTKWYPNPTELQAVIEKAQELDRRRASGNARGAEPSSSGGQTSEQSSRALTAARGTSSETVSLAEHVRACPAADVFRMRGALSWLIVLRKDRQTAIAVGEKLNDPLWYFKLSSPGTFLPFRSL